MVLMIIHAFIMLPNQKERTDTKSVMRILLLSIEFWDSIIILLLNFPFH